LVFAVVLMASSCATKNNSGVSETDSSQVTMVTVANFKSEAEKLVNKPVTIAGTVSHVCKHGGKKMFIFEGSNDSVTVKITTEEAFTAEMEGTDYIVSGIVKEDIVTEEDIAKLELEENEQYKNEKKEKNMNPSCAEEMTRSQLLRKQVADSGKDHLSYYSIAVTNFQEKK